MTARPRDIDCEEVLEQLYGYLDGELTRDREAEVRRHLAQCAPCLATSRFETAFLRFLEARTQAEHAPDRLKKRILERLLFEEPDRPPS